MHTGAENTSLKDIPFEQWDDVIRTRYNGDFDKFRYDLWCDEYVRGADVSEHLTFFNREGLTEEEGDAVYISLVRLGEKTGNMWTPGNCRNMPELTKFANRYYIRSPASKFFKKLIPKRYLHSHFFWCSDSREGNKQLIIDPTGVPEDFQEHLQNNDDLRIKPYFGLFGKAPETHEYIYQRMEDMDDWGTRSLPPGFHP